MQGVVEHQESSMAESLAAELVSTLTDEVEQETAMAESPLDHTQLETASNQKVRRQRRKKAPAHTKFEILPERSVRTRKPPSRYSESSAPVRGARTAKTPKVEYKAKVTVQRNNHPPVNFDSETSAPEASLYMDQGQGVLYEYEEPDISPIQILNSYSLANTHTAAAGPSNKYHGNLTSQQHTDTVQTVPPPFRGRGTFILKTVTGLVLEGVEFPRNRYTLQK